MYRSVLLGMRNVRDRSCRENQNTYSVLHDVFRKSCVLLDNAENYGKARQATDDSMALSRCMLDK